MAIQNPSFENGEPGWNPGNPDDWTIETFNAELWRWAMYQGHMTDPEYWAVEKFQGGWDNDDGFLDELTGAMLKFYEVDGGDAETFNYWPAGILMEWITEFEGIGLDLVPALYTVWAGSLPGIALAESFESEWDNDQPIGGDYLFHLEGWVDGGPPTRYDSVLNANVFDIGTSNDRLKLYLAYWTGFFTSAATIEIEIPTGAWTAAALVVELQTQTDADLVAAGFPPGDILWEVNPRGGLRVSNQKTLYHLWLQEPGVESAWSTLNFDISEYADTQLSDSKPRPYEAGQFSLAQYSGFLDQEWFGLGWNNDVPDYLWWGTHWYDTHADDPTSFDIQAGVNDLIDIWLDDFLGTAVLLQITLAPAVYNLAGMVAELDTKINAALTAAGPPWGPGNIDVAQSPKGQIRFDLQTGAFPNGPNMIFAPPSADPSRDAWPTLGIDEEAWVVGIFSLYRRSRRRPVAGGIFMWDAAMYDGGLNPWENFEGVWTPLP